jgi:SOS-response transcriptional repressor LexA
MEALTTRQREVLDFICEHQRKFSRVPTLYEIAARFGFAQKTGAVCHLRALTRKGYIRRTANEQRAIEVIRKPQSMGVSASVVGETLNRFGFGEALANVLKGCEVIG